MFQAGDTEAEVTRTIACLSPYLRKGESDCLERDRREAVSFPSIVLRNRVSVCLKVTSFKKVCGVSNRIGWKVKG